SGIIPPHPQCHPGLDPGPIPRSHPSRKVAQTIHLRPPTISGWIPRRALDDIAIAADPLIQGPSPSQGEARWGSSPRTQISPVHPPSPPTIPLRYPPPTAFTNQRVARTGL